MIDGNSREYKKQKLEGWENEIKKNTSANRQTVIASAKREVVQGKFCHWKAVDIRFTDIIIQRGQHHGLEFRQT